MKKDLRFKHILGLAVMILFIMGWTDMMGQSSEHTYGDDATVSANYYSPYGGTKDYEYAVYLYDASDVNFDGIITSISFKAAEDVAASDITSYTIYMKDVPSGTTLNYSTTFATYTSGSTLVRSEIKTPALSNGNWNATTLSTTFEHSSENSLLVMIKTTGKDKGHKIYYKVNNYHIWTKQQNTTDPGTNTSGTLYQHLPSIKFTYSPVACPKPTELTASDITKNSATLGWTSDAESFNLQYKATDAENWTTVENISTNSYTLNGVLSPKTTYQFKVQAVCSGTPGSYSNPVSFTTSCTLPYTMGFESSEISEFNALWTVISNNTAQNSSAKRTDDYGLKIGNSSTSSQYIVTPQIDATGGSLSFYYKGYSSTAMSFKVGYSTTTNDVNTAFTWDTESTTVNSDWSEYTKIIPAGTKYIAILINSSSYSYTYIDDITINAPSEINRPTDLSVTNVTYKSAQFNWTAGGSETNWKLQYKGTAAAVWTTVDVSSKPHTISTLDESTTYEWRVAAYIAPNMSDYEQGTSFSTPAQYPAPTGLTASNIMTSGASFTWDETTGADSYNLRYSVSSPESWTTVNGLTEETYTISSGLTGNTTYKVQVQAIYGGSPSAWTENSFTTLPIKRYTSTSITPTMNNWNHYMAWTPTGVPEITHDVVIEQNAQILSDNTAVANDVTINTDVTLTIRSNATLTCNNITNNGTLIIEDGGQLVCNNSVQVTMNKTTTAWNDVTKQGWYAISSPVNNIAIADFVKGGDEGHNVYRYDEPTRYWHEYRRDWGGNPAFNNLSNGCGYLYRSTQDDIAFQGNTIVEATYTLKYTNNGDNMNGFNLIGNPYTHNIYKGANTAIASEYLEEGFYTLGTNGGWTAATDNSTAIAPTQGILVQATSEADGETLTITNTTNQGSSKAGNDQIMFSVKNSEYSDQAYVLFKKGHGLNKIEHRNNAIPMLYVTKEDENFAIADIEEGSSVVNLGFEAKTIGQYTFSLKAEGQYSYMHLYDKLTGNDVDMLLEDSYTFIGAPSDRKDRFVLNLNYNAGSSTGSETFAYQSGNDIMVSGEGELQVFDVMGRMVMSQRINGVETVNGLNNGVYIFRMEGKTQKIVVR